MDEVTEGNDFDLTIPQTGLQIGRSTQQTYLLAQHGEIRVLLRNGRWFASRASVAKYIERHQLAVA